MTIAENIAKIRENMTAAAREAGRDPKEILLVGASKMNDAAACREAVAAGIDALGENRVQEMVQKLEQHAYDGAPLHFIGHLQRNKVKQVVGHVALIQSVGSLELLDEIEKVAAARDLGRERLTLVLEAICATGIRVSEVRFLTVEAALRGRAEVSLKGKIRTILLPGKLCRKPLKYARRQKIASGEIFLTRGGNSLSRKQIWAEMKALCRRAGVGPSKVFPHNLRHLFARLFYRATRDVARLADVLGHSSIETTRVYLVTTGAEHARTLERLRLIC